MSVSCASSQTCYTFLPLPPHPEITFRPVLADRCLHYDLCYVRIGWFRWYMGIVCKLMLWIITVHNSSCGKVMFSQACVKNSVHGEGNMWPYMIKNKNNKRCFPEMAKNHQHKYTWSYFSPMLICTDTNHNEKITQEHTHFWIIIFLKHFW